MDSNEKELTLTPIAGKSGKAFMGTYPDGGKVFVKMNTTLKNKLLHNSYGADAYLTEM